MSGPDSRPALVVALVDDSALSRLVTCRQLDMLGCITVCADSSAALEQLLSREAPDVFLFDYNLQDGENGAELALLCRKRGMLQPMYAFSASLSEKERTACFQAGIDGVLIKPLMLKDLEEIFTRVRSRESTVNCLNIK